MKLSETELERLYQLRDIDRISDSRLVELAAGDDTVKVSDMESLRRTDLDAILAAREFGGWSSQLADAIGRLTKPGVVSAIRNWLMETLNPVGMVPAAAALSVLAFVAIALYQTPPTAPGPVTDTISVSSFEASGQLASGPGAGEQIHPLASPIDDLFSGSFETRLESPVFQESFEIARS